MLKRLLGNKVTKNAIWLIAGRVYHMILAFLVGLLTARYLGPKNYGLINYAATYTSFFASFCTLGINSIIVKNFVDHPDEEGETIGSAIFLRFLSSALSVVMMLRITFIADRNESVTHVVVFLCGIGVLFQVFDTFNYWFQAHLQSKYSSMAAAISYTVVSVYKIWLLIRGKSVQWFAVSTSIDYLVVAAVLYFIYRKISGPRITCSLRKAKELFGSSYHFILSSIMVSIYGSTDKFMLKQLLSESEVGYYATAIQVCNIWVFVLSAIIDSMYPMVLQSFDKGEEVFELQNRRLYAIVFYLSTVVSLGITIVAPYLIAILYGAEYLASTKPLMIITWYTAFSYLGVARNAWIVCHNYQKYLKYLYGGAAASNVILNLIFIPLFGASGAALASLLTQISTIIVFPAMIRQLRPNTKLMLEAIALKGLREK